MIYSDFHEFNGWIVLEVGGDQTEAFRVGLRSDAQGVVAALTTAS